MNFFIFISKVVRRLGVHQLAYRFMSCMPLGLRSVLGMGYKDALEAMFAVSPDDGSSCLCSRVSDTAYTAFDLDIIIPVYNTDRFLTECIESVLGQQTRFTFHVTVVNDGSTDGSRDILKRYETDGRVTVIDQENRGFSGARNTGLRNTCGRYISFVDSDDVLPQGAIETLMSKAVSGDFDIVSGGYSRYDGHRDVRTIVPEEGELFGLVCGKVYKVSVWDNLQFPNNYWFEDTINVLVVYDRCKKCTSVKDIVYRWRKNTEGITYMSIGRPKVLDTVYVTIRLLADRRKLGLPMDSGFYENFLYQFKENTLRVLTLNNRKLNYANFVISKYLFTEYYGENRMRSTMFREIEEALSEDDFKKFILACICL